MIVYFDFEFLEADSRDSNWFYLHWLMYKISLRLPGVPVPVKLFVSESYLRGARAVLPLKSFDESGRAVL